MIRTYSPFMSKQGFIILLNGIINKISREQLKIRERVDTYEYRPFRKN